MSEIRFSSQTATTETPIADIVGVRAVSGPAVPTRQINDRITVQQLPPSYEWGEGAIGPFETLPADSKVAVGDTLRITYKLGVPFLQGWQTDFIVSRINADSRFELQHVALNDETRLLVVEVKVIKPFSPAIFVAAAIAAVLIGALIWTTTLSIERLGTIQVGDTTFKLGPLLVIGGLVVAALFAVASIKRSK